MRFGTILTVEDGGGTGGPGSQVHTLGTLRRCGAIGQNGCTPLLLCISAQQPSTLLLPHLFLSTTMSYNDPYYSSQNNTRYQGPYKDTPDYDPYNTRHQRHPTYDGSGFPDDEPTLETTPVQNSKERAEYDKSGFATTALPVPEKCVLLGSRLPFIRLMMLSQFRSRSGLRSWRRDHHGNLWTKV